MHAPTGITVFSGLAVKKAFDDAILPLYAKTEGLAVNEVFDPTVKLLERIKNGEFFDVLIAAEDAFKGIDSVEAVTPFIKTGIGLATAVDKEHVDISTRDRFVDVIRNSRSVAYSRNGQSGIFFVELMKKLGISEEVLPKAT